MEKEGGGVIVQVASKICFILGLDGIPFKENSLNPYKQLLLICHLNCPRLGGIKNEINPPPKKISNK